MKNLNPIMISGKEVFPLIEGGKGINASDGRSSGAWAKENCVGTFSGVSPDYYDENGNVIREHYEHRDRASRHLEMVEQSIKGCLAQAQVAHEVSGGNGRIHMNMLWELAGSQQILTGVLEKAKGLINGVTCGAGLPYNLGEIASKFGVYYYPIISSARAFQVLWKRAYNRFVEYLGGVVYEDPWLAGGHNGLSNAENPNEPQTPYARLVELRSTMNALGLQEKPIILAGGIWALEDWQDYIDNPEIGKIAFQFGTRPMITKESPISDAWKNLMLKLKQGDVILQKFSPTGFFSSAIKNTFLSRLIDRKQGEVEFVKEANDEFSHAFKMSETKTVYIRPQDAEKANNQIVAGYSEAVVTPDSTLVFLTPDEWVQMKEDRKNCVGCLSQCQFSSWSQAKGTTGRLPDPRSYCIHKTLYDVSHNGSIIDNLLFAGHQVYRFATDPLYRNGVPSVKELIERIKTGK
ncbi:MAG: nitronate monooxygenase [Alphaproteobacteria bacterium]|nr:nitronate monooxygenase [Alphaproteobacteria bacterium]